MISAIIQARMSSTRLPEKVLAPIAGQPMLMHIVTRARAARTLDQVIVATSDDRSDDTIQQLCDTHGIQCFRGALNDVLDRYYQAARAAETTTIVRLTADDPLIDPKIVDLVVSQLDSTCDYVSNTLQPTYPDGMDVEAFTMATLERAWREATLGSEREHVTPYITKHPELFRLRGVRHTVDLAQMRWAVDEPRDLAFVRAVYDRLGSEFGMQQVLDLLDAEPALGRINEGISRNEGYQTSLLMDQEKQQ